MKLEERFGASQRRACAVVGQHRSTQRHRKTHQPSDEALRKRLHELARRNRRLGYKKQHAILCREGWKVNRKRVRRLWCEEGLKVPPRTKRRRRGKRVPGYLEASRPDQVWAIDFVFDDITRGRKIKILNVTDEFTRESLAGEVARHIKATDVITALEQIVERRGAPSNIRCDNGPEFIAKALQRWCSSHGSRTSHIEPGAPWQNPFVESYNGKLRKELLDLELIDTVLEGQVLVDDWRDDYNNYRPHQSLNYLTPREFATRWKKENQARVSQQVDR